MKEGEYTFQRDNYIVGIDYCSKGKSTMIVAELKDGVLHILDFKEAQIKAKILNNELIINEYIVSEELKKKSFKVTLQGYKEEKSEDV